MLGHTKQAASRYFFKKK